MASTSAEQLPIEAVLSLESAVETLTTSLSSPFTTTICARRMYVAGKRLMHGMFSLGPSASMTERHNFVRSYPRLLRAGIRFLTMKQTQKSHADMVVRLVHCQCEELAHGTGPEAVTRMKRLHNMEKELPPDMYIYDNITSLRSAVNTVAVVIQAALSGLKKTHKFYAPVPGKGEDDQPWPLSVEDLFPHGLQGSAQGLETWSEWEDLSGSLIFELTRALVESYPPFAIALIQPPHYNFAINRPLGHLTAAMNYYEEQPTHADNCSIMLFKDAVKNVFNFLQLFVLEDPSQAFFGMMAAKVGEITPVFDRLSNIIASILPSVDAPEDRDDLSEILLAMDVLLKVGNKRLRPAEGLGEDPVKDALREMIIVRKGGCTNLRCLKKSDSANSRLCSKCDLMRYCGPECQKEAWKSTIFPHKKLCTMVHTFKRSLTSETWTSLWDDDMLNLRRFCSTPNTDGRLIDKELVSAIGKTLAEMKGLKALYDEMGMGKSEADFLAQLSLKY
ncbi:hypothetical protein DFP72DRAFT_907519 [Ephemerocybe angulata]|uniref:MYND-type domain-containing protein n=1 Tax=Ephemerocybe angulata TaxID=980116 RepID=A0A8H6M0Y3_9AGAR|nr:hypothetical protein DFP72DRAFT_907519 [Tulosesus angulatus]